jgi:tetratricopeptide (TPR) repeat protein
MEACNDVLVQALVDGELHAGDARAVRQHLGHCPACQQSLEDALCFEALAAGLAQSSQRRQAVTVEVEVAPERHRAPRRWFRRKPTFLVILGFSFAGMLPLWMALRSRTPNAGAVFAAIEREPRYHEWRVAYPQADHHRPYEGARGSEDRGQPLIVDLSALERTGDERALAAAELLVGMAGQAQAHLRHLPQTADVLNDEAAAALARGDLAGALALVDRALLDRPDHPQALWNKAVILDRRGDAAGAAALFRAVAKQNEPGWSAEALSRAGPQPSPSAPQ